MSSELHSSSWFSVSIQVSESSHQTQSDEVENVPTQLLQSVLSEHAAKFYKKKV